jgi:carboxyl-terminal processing protease
MDILTTCWLVLRYDKLNRLLSWVKKHIPLLSEKNMSRNRYLIILLIVFIGFTGAFLSGYFLKSYFDRQVNEFPVLDQAYNILTDHAYIELPESKSIEYGMIRGMLDASGDPFAVFLEPVQHELETNSLQGSFGGIGVELTQNQKGEILIYPILDGPASRAGIQSGDRILSVDDLIITQVVSIDDVHAALRGRIGGKVKVVTTRKPDDSRLKFSIKRELIHLPSVTWHIDPDYSMVGIINVNIIAESTPEEIQNAVSELERKGAAHFVLDLRNNGGGLLSAGVETAKLFLRNGVVIQQQYRGEDIESFTVNKPGPLQNISLIILVNRATASAAEIIAGSLQAHNRAFLVGEPTFGKDTIQLVFDLQDDSSLHVTAAKWWIPGIDPPISENGLQPDVSVLPGEAGTDLMMKVAIQTLLEN